MAALVIKEVARTRAIITIIIKIDMKQNFSIEPAPRLHHACTTPAPRLHHACTTPAPRLRHACATPAPRLRHACATPAPPFVL
jgi:hypothetical protein